MQFGVITYSLDPSQQGIMIAKALNDHIATHTNLCPIVFYRDYYQSLITPLFPMMQEVEAWQFTGPVIATSLESAKRLLKYPSPSKKFLYVLNLEWTYEQNANYDELSSIYANINLIARSQDHFNLLKNTWATPVGIAEDFNCQQIMGIIS